MSGNQLSIKWKEKEKKNEMELTEEKIITWHTESAKEKKNDCKELI